MVAQIFEFSPFTRRADSLPRPTQEHRNLGDVERSHAILEHLWNTTAVHRWGSLVRIGFNECYAP